MKVHRTAWKTVYRRRSGTVNLFAFCIRSTKQFHALRVSLSPAARKECMFAVSVTSLLFYSDGRDFDSGVVDQGCRLNGRAGWFGIGHDALVHLVHVGEFMNVGEIDGDADHIF